jgi:glycosyltransferase involved in cell wall biosynthesis
MSNFVDNARVLIVLPGNQLFGQEQAMIVLARILEESEHDIHFLIHRGWGGELAKKLDSFGFTWSMMPFGTIWSVSFVFRRPAVLVENIRAVFSCSRMLMRLLREGSFTHILMGNATFGYYLLPALLKRRISVIYRHGDDVAAHSFFHRIMSWLLFRRTNHHVANCHYLKKRLKSRFDFIDADVIYNLARSTPTKGEQSSNEAIEESSRARSVLFVGQLARHKGISEFLGAIRRLAPVFSDVEFTIVGAFPGVTGNFDTEMQHELDEVAALFPKRVNVHGFTDQLDEFYRTAYVHVCPSISQDPSPNVIFEAKQYGVPTVAYRVGGVPELISHTVDGYLCDDMDSDSLAKGIEYYLLDSNVRAEASRQAKKRATSVFGPERFRSEWLGVLGISP